MKSVINKRIKKVLGKWYIPFVLIILVIAIFNRSIDLNSIIEKSSMEDSRTVKKNTKPVTSNETYEVIRVIDGDTIQIKYNGENEKLRLIGIDTPESVHPDKSKNTEQGEISSRYTKEKLEGKYVEIEFDVQERDKYGRLLAYVYIDGIMFNKTLLEEGYAKLATYPPNIKYVDEFAELQKNARNNKIGIWE